MNENTTLSVILYLVSQIQELKSEIARLENQSDTFYKLHKDAQSKLDAIESKNSEVNDVA